MLVAYIPVDVSCRTVVASKLWRLVRFGEFIRSEPAERQTPGDQSALIIVGLSRSQITPVRYVKYVLSP
jgi:hypothetical protein